MATGYFYAASNQGGSVPGKFGVNAGDGLTVYDWCLTQGPNPWTKIVTGTNTASYQAPGGSQIKIDIDDTYAITSSLASRARTTVAGTQFPIAAQEATGSYGGVPMIRKTMGTAAANCFEWISIRTDRLWLLYTGGNSSGQVFYSSMHIFGDLPTLDPADPGVCANLACFGSNTYPIMSLPAAWLPNLNTTAQSIGGHTYINKANTMFSPLTFALGQWTSNVGSLTLSDYAGAIPAYPVYLATSTTSQFNASAQVLPRAWIPYIRILPLRPDLGFGLSPKWLSNVTPWVGDTATIGGNSYDVMYSSSAQFTLAIMTNDGENLP
jgi:hypothetical protein